MTIKNPKIYKHVCRHM